jgi:hypothetical protein
VRLSSEQLRDAQLAGCGTLNRTPGDGFLRPPELRVIGLEQQRRRLSILSRRDWSAWQHLSAASLRTLSSPPVLQAFDPVEQGMTTNSPVYNQFLSVISSTMNFLQRQALHLAEELSQSESGDGDRVTRGYFLAEELVRGLPAGLRSCSFSLEFLREHRSLAGWPPVCGVCRRSAAAEPAVLIDSEPQRQWPASRLRLRSWSILTSIAAGGSNSGAIVRGFWCRFSTYC